MQSVFGCLFGFLCGFVVNYLADVLPIFRKLTYPVCIHCKTNYPFLQFFFLPGRCPNCKVARSLRSWLVIFGMAIFGFIWSEYSSPRIGMIMGIIIAAYLVLITVIDIEYRLILHYTSIAGYGLGFLCGITMHGFRNTLLGGVFGFGIMFIFYSLGIFYVKIKQKRPGETLSEGDALGFGDVMLGGVVGFLLGWPGIIMGLIVAILSAGAVSLVFVVITLLRKQYHSNIAIPYGPFLTLSAFLLLFIRPFIR